MAAAFLPLHFAGHCRRPLLHEVLIQQRQDRLTSDTAGSYSYDALGRTTTVPAGDATGIGSHAATSGVEYISYYSNDMAATETQGGTMDTFTLDPQQNRIATQIDDPTNAVNHYSSGADSPSWTAIGSNWTGNIIGIDGNLAATVTQTGAVTFELANPHGDIIATVGDTKSATGPASYSEYSEYSEYGTPWAASSGFDEYGYLGGDQRSSDDLGGLILMGARLYTSTGGRFVSVVPVAGGNANSYIYPNDPVNSPDPYGSLGSSQRFSNDLAGLTLMGARLLNRRLVPILRRIRSAIRQYLE